MYYKAGVIQSMLLDMNTNLDILTKNGWDTKQQMNRYEQKIYERINTNGQETNEKMLNIASSLGSTNYSYSLEFMARI